MEYYRRSIRLRDFDYRSAGAYFVTICAHQKEHLFGEIIHGEVKRNWVGDMVRQYWDGLPEHFSNIEIDEFVVMPNHVHGIIWIRDALVGATHASPLRGPNGPPSKSIGSLVGSFKSAASKRIHTINPLFGSIWQRNYFERIIRCDSELLNVRQYIRNNPLKWEDDPERR